jgi:hypothetical protein
MSQFVPKQHPEYNRLAPEKANALNWSRVTFEEALDHVKTISNYTLFRNQHGELYSHVVNQGWLLMLLPYISHSQQSYREAVVAHEAAMDAISRREARERKRAKQND